MADITPTSGDPRTRRRGRPWINAIVFLGILGVGGRLAFAFAAPIQWPARIFLETMDCSEPRACRFRAGEARDLPDLTGTRHAPFRANALGFRGSLPPIERSDPAELRVFVFGDSLTLGTGVLDDETLPAALERSLRARLQGRPVVVANFGMLHTVLVSNLAVYERFARVYRPDVVVLAGMQPTTTDMNSRIRDIRASRLLTWLIRRPWGAEIVGRIQNVQALIELDDVDAAIRSAARPLYEDQTRQGTAVVFWEFFALPTVFGLHDAPRRALAALPPGLRTTRVRSGLTVEQYLNSPWCLAGDGHPTGAGHAHFAEILADGLLRNPDVQRRLAASQPAR